MGSAPMSLDRPPMPPPATLAQTGANPFAPVGGMMAKEAQPLQAGAADPHTGAKAEADLLNRILDSMSRKYPKFAPFAAKAQSIIEAGMAEAMSSIPGASPTEPGTAGGEGSVAQPPMNGGGSMNFPG